MALPDLRDGPAGVFGDEFFFAGGGALQSGQIVRRADVAQRDAHVAQQPAPFGALDGRTLEGRAEILLAHRRGTRAAAARPSRAAPGTPPRGWPARNGSTGRRRGSRRSRRCGRPCADAEFERDRPPCARWSGTKRTAGRRGGRGGPAGWPRSGRHPGSACRSRNAGEWARPAFEGEGGQQFGQEEPGAQFRGAGASCSCRASRRPPRRRNRVPARGRCPRSSAAGRRASAGKASRALAALAFDEVVVIVAPGVTRDAAGAGARWAAERGPCQ